MTWSEVDLDARLWTLPKERSKNGQPHDIPLSEPAVAILKSLPRIGDTFVLTTDGKSAASNYSANKRRLDALLPADMPPLVAARSAAHRGVGHGPPRHQPAGDREGSQPLRAARSPASSASISATTFPMKNATRSSAGGRMSPIWFRAVAARTSSGSRHGLKPRVDAFRRGGEARRLVRGIAAAPAGRTHPGAP